MHRSRKAYVGNNPVNFVDPLGLTTTTWPRYWPIIVPAFPIVAPIIINPVTVGIGVGIGVLLWPSTTAEDPADPLRRRLERAKCEKAYAECVKDCVKCPGHGGPEVMECIRNKCVPALKKCLSKIK